MALFSGDCFKINVVVVGFKSSPGVEELILRHRSWCGEVFILVDILKATEGSLHILVTDETRQLSLYQLHDVTIKVIIVISLVHKPIASINGFLKDILSFNWFFWKFQLSGSDKRLVMDNITSLSPASLKQKWNFISWWFPILTCVNVLKMLVMVFLSVFVLGIVLVLLVVFVNVIVDVVVSVLVIMHVVIVVSVAVIVLGLVFVESLVGVEMIVLVDVVVAVSDASSSLEEVILKVILSDLLLLFCFFALQCR